MFLFVLASDAAQYKGKKLPSGKELVDAILERPGVNNRRVAIPVDTWPAADKQWVRDFLESHEYPYATGKWFPKNWRTWAPLDGEE